jgi:hypothetical protein
MKNITILICLFFTILYSNAQLDTGTFELELPNDNYQEIILLKIKGTTITAKLINNGFLKATWNEENNKLTGYIKLYSDSETLYEFNAFVENDTESNLILGQYCHCTNDETNLFMSLTKL